MKLKTWLVLAGLTLWGSTLSGQEAPQTAPTSQTPYSVSAIGAPNEQSASDDLVARLQRTEARLAELESGKLAETEESSDDWFGHFVSFVDPAIATAREQTYSAAESASPSKPKKKWYDKLSIRGYAQFRFNQLLSEQDGSAPPQHVGDRSIGEDQSFLIRRARVIISGDVHEHLYVYLQPDFASSVPGSNDNTYYTQIRDWYGDFYLDRDKVHRFRIGQSKIPYGWENLQSSSNRIPLDRADGLNSAARNERDLGVFYYWTPTWAQDFFKDVLEEGLKGSGNYGLFGIGAYNGQGGSLLEQNDRLHLVSRLTLPFTLANCQRFEVGVQGYYGQYAVIGSTIDPPGAPAPSRPIGTVDFTSAATIEATAPYRDGWMDKRVAGSFIWYPQPIGFQAEWNVGRGPALNEAQTRIEDRSLTGGYAMLMGKIERESTWFPFVRYGFYEGGYKAERNAPYVTVSEWEAGVEWQINPAAELTLSYLNTDRTNTTANGLAGSNSYGQYVGDVLRAQFQINY